MQQLRAGRSGPTSAGSPRRASEPDDVVEDLVVDVDRVADELAEPRDVGRRHAPLDRSSGQRATCSISHFVRRRSGSRRAASSRTDRAAPRAACRRLPARPGSAWRAPRTDRRAGTCVSASVTCRSCIASSSALCVFGVRAVDLVGEQDVGEHRALLDPERRGLGVVDARAEDVGRQQVRRELDALELRRDRLRQRRRGQRLGDAGHAFEQQVAAADARARVGGRERNRGEQAPSAAAGSARAGRR